MKFLKAKNGALSRFFQVQGIWIRCTGPELNAGFRLRELTLLLALSDIFITFYLDEMNQNVMKMSGYLARARARAPGPRERVGPPALTHKEYQLVFKARALFFAALYHWRKVQFLLEEKRKKSDRTQFRPRTTDSEVLIQIFSCFSRVVF